MKTANDLAKRIIHEQQIIMGPLAWRVAKDVKGLDIKNEHDIVLLRNPAMVLSRLVGKYEELFGPASREVCRDAVRSIVEQVPKKDVPDVLR